MPDEQPPANPQPEHADLVRRRRNLEACRASLELTAVPTSLGRRLRASAPTLVKQITTAIQAEVNAYAGPATGRAHQIIAGAVHVAVEQFADFLEDRPTHHQNAFTHFWNLGRREAQSGHPLDALRAAQLVAIHTAVAQLRVMVAAEQLPARLNGVLTSALVNYLRQLVEHAVAGYTTVNGCAHGVEHRQLFDALMHRNVGEVQRLAAIVDWPVTEKFVVAVLEHAAEKPVSIPELPKPVLVRHLRKESALVIACTGKVDGAALLRTLGAGPIAHSWPVPIGEIPDAYRWAKLALHLAAHGIITEAPIIDCTDHRQLLWLHADPTLGEHLHRDLLKPLLDAPRHQRLKLATTMLVWLRTHASAPVIAAELGVHKQTVRNRVVQLRQMFGEPLDDAEATVTLLMALEAAVPRWQAEAVPRRRARSAEEPTSPPEPEDDQG